MIKRTLFLFIYLCICHLSWGADLEIKIDPNEPVIGESFRVDFIITSEKGTDPVINFEPLGVEVISRQESGVSTRTTYINGKLSIERKITISYEMMAERGYSAYLRKINVELNDEKLSHKSVKIKLLQKARASKDIFIQAEVPKDEYFVGESIIIRYYLYSKLPINSMDVKKFPKLDKFLKRFHQETSSAERVKYGGEIYTRRVIYTTQAFAQKEGEFKIDPIAINVRYSTRSRDSFQNFGLGFGLGKINQRTLRSKILTIKAISLPNTNIPEGFTGLVGEHKFNLKINKNKFLANEPIEIKLSVEGPGALELFEAPKILKDAAIEEFENDVDLKINQDFSAKKTFDYTYLGRSKTQILNNEIPFSYFDPNLLKFVTVKLKLGDVIVASVGKKLPVGITNTEKASTQITNPVEREYTFEPIYKGMGTFIYHSTNIFMLALAGIFLIGILFIARLVTKAKKREITFIDEVKLKGVNYGKLHKLIFMLGPGKDMNDVVTNASLSDELKSYLKGIISDLNANYETDANDMNIKVPKKHLKSLELFLSKKENHENIHSTL